MKRILIILICSLFAVPAFSYDEEAKEEFFLSTPEQVATFTVEPSYLVGGLISPLSGQPTLRQTDLVIIRGSKHHFKPHLHCAADSLFFFERKIQSRRVG